MGFIVDIVKRLSQFEYVSAKGTLHRQSWHNPAAPGNTAIHAAVTCPATGTTTVTTAITNPDFARTVRVKGAASGQTGNVVITGTDQFGVVKTDTIALSGAGAIDGVVAFKTITSFVVPAKVNSSGDTVSLGLGPALGLERHISTGIVFAASFGGTQEGTQPTMNATRNTAQLSTALDGAHDVVIYFPHEDLANA